MDARRIRPPPAVTWRGAREARDAASTQVACLRASATLRRRKVGNVQERSLRPRKRGRPRAARWRATRSRITASTPFPAPSPERRKSSSAMSLSCAAPMARSVRTCASIRTAADCRSWEAKRGSLRKAWWIIESVSAFLWRASPMSKKLLKRCSLFSDWTVPVRASTRMRSLPAKLRMASRERGVGGLSRRVVGAGGAGEGFRGLAADTRSTRNGGGTLHVLPGVAGLGELLAEGEDVAAVGVAVGEPVHRLA